MNPKIKMIAFDLDGTLLTTDKKITEYTKKVLDQAIAKGITVVPVTGRPLLGLPRELKNYEGIEYMIASNGARGVRAGETLRACLLPTEKARQILDILEEYDTIQEVYYDGQGYAPKRYLEEMESYIKNPAGREYVRETRKFVDNVREKLEAENRDLDKMQGMFRDPDEKADAWKRLEALGNIEVTGALSMNIEINGEGVHKGAALLWLAGKLNIKPEEIITFGDGANDIKMITAAGIGVAMGNAIDSVKEAADLIAPANDEEGVAKIIQKYVLDRI